MSAGSGDADALGRPFNTAITQYESFSGVRVSAVTGAVTGAWAAGVEPWQMLGYLQGALERDGAITAAQWQAAIDSQTGRKSA